MYIEKDKKKIEIVIKCNLNIFILNYRVAFGKVWYDIYDNRREHIASLVLRKSHIRSKIQHRVPEFEIIGNDETTNIGRIYPFSTDLQRSEYGQAVAVKGIFEYINYCFEYDLFLVPQDMKVEAKATLLMATLILVNFL
jgi:hypothetical protein